MDVKEMIDDIQVAVCLKDRLDRGTKVEGSSVVSNHQRFVEVTENRDGGINVVPGIAWPNDSAAPAMDYGGMKTVNADEESERVAERFAEYLLGWREDLDFPGGLVEKIAEIVEDRFDGAVEVEWERHGDAAEALAACGSGIVVQFNELDGGGFYGIAAFREGGARPVYEPSMQDAVEGWELGDDEKLNGLAEKYSAWLIGEIVAVQEVWPAGSAESPVTPDAPCSAGSVE